MSSKFTKHGERQTPNPEVGPPDRILWVDALSDRLKAQDEEGSPKERSDRGKPEDHSCEIRQKLGERFATAARLYAEAVVVFTSSPLTASEDEYNRLRKATEEARARAEAIGKKLEEHVASHRCGRGTPSQA